MVTELLLIAHATAKAASTARALLFHCIYIEKAEPTCLAPEAEGTSTSPLAAAPACTCPARAAHSNAPIIGAFIEVISGERSAWEAAREQVLLAQ